MHKPERKSITINQLLMAKNLFFLLFMFFTLLSAAQRVQQRIEVGDEFYENGQYEQAIEVYQKILKKEDEAAIRNQLSFKVGNAYRELLNYEEAKKWYQIALNLGYSRYDIYLYLSEMTLGLEEFDSAIDYITRYLEQQPDDDIAIKLLESALFARENYFTETIFETSNESGINNPGQQWGVSFLENVAVIYDDQAKVDEQFDINIRVRYNNIFYWIWSTRELKERIIFSSTQAMDGSLIGFSNIYQATFNKREKEWDNPEPLSGGINSDYYDGFLSYDKVNETAYFMNSGGKTGNRATSDIYTVGYNKQDDSWGQPQIFPYNNDEFNIGYPSINEDGSVLYFASDMPGGFGGYDIYKMIRESETEWSDPINLGDSVNTEFNDSYPFIMGNVLYFSSYGHPGFGGFDVFYSTKNEDGSYSEPVNMGAPVNSSADDFGFVIDENYTRGYFSSNRPGGSGEDDIFSFRVIPKTFDVKGRVTDVLTGEPVKGLEMYFFDDENNLFTTTTDPTGNYVMADLATDVNYYISAFPADYQEVADTIAVADQLLSSRFEVITEYEKNLELMPLNIPEEEEEEGPEPAEGVIEKQAEPVAEVVEDQIIEKPEPEPEYETTLVEETFPEVEKEPVFNLSSEDFPTIYFDFASAVLDTEDKEKLNQVAAFLKNNPDKGVIINAHTDEISGYLFNFYLSQERAKSALRYLKKKNIETNRLYPQGHGKMDLAFPNAKTESEHKQNRRATFESIPVSELQAYLKNASRHSFRYLNNIQKDAYFAEGVEFMVQFMASNVPIHPTYYQRIMENMPDVDIIYYYDTDRYHRYLAGSFDSFDAAFTLQAQLRNLGYEIYIVAFDNGVRIPVSKARRMTGQL